jgi:hypothetical protein
VIESLLQEGESPSATAADLTPYRLRARARKHTLTDMIDHRPVEADERSRDHQGLEIVPLSTPFFSDEVDQPLGIAIVDLSLAGEQRRAVGEDPRDRQRIVVTNVVSGLQEPSRLEHEASERVDDRRPGSTFGDRLEQRILEVLHPVVGEVLLRREVVEDRRL